MQPPPPVGYQRYAFRRLDSRTLVPTTSTSPPGSQTTNQKGSVTRKTTTKMAEKIAAEMEALVETLGNLAQNHRVTDERIQQLQQQIQPPKDAVANLAHIGASSKSTALMPKPFAGDPTADATQFIDRFNQYCAYAGIEGKEGKDKLKLIPLLLEGRAASWYKGLEDATCKSWTTFSETFSAKYGPKAMGFLKETALLSRTQRENESVDSYTNDMLARLNLTGTEEPARWKAYVQGLRPSIKQYVLDKDPTSIDQAETLARKAEQLQALTQDSALDNAVSKLQALLLTQAVSSKAATAEASSQPTNQLVDMVKGLQTQVQALSQSQQQKAARNKTDELTEVVQGLQVQIQALSTGQPDQDTSTPAQQTNHKTSRTTDGRPRCSRCGGNHYTNSCRTPRVSNPISCHFCQRRGHVISECWARQKWEKNTCTVCGNQGHSAMECAMAKVQHLPNPHQPQQTNNSPNPNAQPFNPQFPKNC